MSLFPTKDTTYNNQEIGTYQGAATMFFDDAVMTSRQIRNMLRSLLTVTDQPISGSVLENSLFSPAYGYHYYSAPTGQSLCSMYLPIASEGAILVLNGLNLTTDANVFVSLVTGAALQRPSGSSISSINMSAGAYVVMICTSDGTWSIVEHTASATVQVAS